VEIEHLLSSTGNGLQVSSRPIVDTKQGMALHLRSWSDDTNPSPQKPSRYKTLRIASLIRGWIQIEFFAKS